METWAMKMIDSNGRLPAGLLEGTLTSLGSYDQCLDIVSASKESNVSTFQGQYCTVLLRPPLPARSPKYSSIAVGVKALSNFSKPGEVFHDFSQNAQYFYSVAIRLGICVPSTCSRLEAQKAVSKASDWLRLKGNVQNCETKKPVEVTARQIVSLLTPPVILVLCLLFLLPFLGSGPNWLNIVIPYVEGCYSTWWRNLLYINSLYKPEQCLGQTWYISCDFIFHVLSLMVFIPMFRNSGLIAAIRYYNPIHHLGSYCIGLYAGYAIVKKKFESISKFSVILGWLFSSFLFLSVMYGMRSWNSGVEGSTVVAVMYASLHRPLWALSVAWVILMCVTGRGGIINILLSWKPFLSLDRMTYMLYLIHHVVITVYNGYTSYTVNYKPITYIYIFCGHMFISYLVSIACILLVESPCVAITSKYFSSHKSGMSCDVIKHDQRGDGVEMVRVE
ncbi:O-acyltransferase like protein-like [Limulus polyphemus]|uniref:O-acyltransferase like protein-like n=1 Tax=Limulus polyphemus TaxID=6850 RepID=A0ABM1S0R8_LIMPO|nr:O-acyltransferase like protein-like [Limulus polyphemus]